MPDLDWTVTADEVEQVAAMLGDMAANIRTGYMEAAAVGDGLAFRLTPLGEAFDEPADPRPATMLAPVEFDDEPEAATCGHEHVIGDVAYACERRPHPVDGYDAEHLHAAPIDAGMAKGTDEQDGFGPADVVTWGEDGNGDGQDWAIGWGPVEPDRSAS